MQDATYEQIVEKLRRRYGSREQQEKFRTELKYRRRKPGESLQELALSVERITKLAYPTADSTMRDLLSKDAFVDSLNSPGLEYKVREREPTTLIAAVTSAMKLEVLHDSLEFRRESHRAKFAKGAHLNESFNDFKPQNKNKGARNVQQSRHDSGPSGAPSRQSQPQRAGNSTSECRPGIKQELTTSLDAKSADILLNITEVIKGFKQEVASIKSERLTPTCHPASPTPMPMMNSWNYYPPSPTRMIESNRMSPTAHRRPWTIQNSNVAPPRPPLRCYGCGEVGHFKRDCPKNNGPRLALRSVQRQLAPAHVRGATGKDSTVTNTYLRVSICGKTHLCLLDTGCEVTRIPAKMVDPRNIRQESQQLLAANGTKIPVMGTTTLDAYVDSHRISIQGLVSRHVTDVMLGADWLKENAAVWDFAADEIVMANTTFRLHARKDKRKWCRGVTIASDSVIPARWI